MMRYKEEKEAKKEAFRKYLESSGVLDSLTKVLVSLYEQNDKPSSALEFIQQIQKLGGPSVSEYEKLQAEKSDLQIKYNELLAKHQETLREAEVRKKIMDSDAWKIIHIPEKPALSPDHQPTVKVYASVIKPKFANTIVRHLCKIAPLEDFRHVKRVKKKILPDHGETQLTVILCLAPEHHDHLNDMPPDVQKLVDPYELSPFITEVCKYAAVSKEEWEEQNKIWPTSFHPPTYNIDGIGGFSEEDTESICKFMRVVIDMAVSNDNPLVNAAVIVDPSVRRIISSETDQVYASSAPRDMTSAETMPFKETREICLNGILEKQNDSLSAVACLNPWQWSLQPFDTGKCSQWHPLRHASIVAIESSSARDRYLFPNSSESFGPDHSQPSNADSPAKKQKISIHSPDVQTDSREEALRVERPYLCTGYDIFLLWEPCTMCAMALVHQRIKRIFYAFPNPTAGGLGSVHRLQGEKSLNHHYAVFRVFMPDDALKHLIRV